MLQKILEKIRLKFTVASLFLLLVIPVSTFAAPVIFYTDIVSGPNTGGENNNGTYLSIFGKGFGTSRGTSTVTINGIEVAAYKQWGAPSKVYDSHGIQVITVQPGSKVTSGPIVVTVSGEKSNSNHSFTIKSGDIYFVSTTGNDSTGVIGDITKPFRNVHTVYSRSDFGPGDTIVVRGGIYTADDNGGFLHADKWGVHEEPAGSGNWVLDDYLMIIGYPGEDVLIDNPQDGLTTAGIYFYKGAGGHVFANMRQNQRGSGSSFFSHSSSAQHYVRIVNWEMEDMQGTGGGAGGISWSGTHHKLLGINIHNIGASKLYHNIYLSIKSNINTSDIEIAYSHIWDNNAGRGIQLYDTDPYEIKNITIHDNIIHDIALHGITFSDHSTTGISVYNNIIYNTGHGTGEGSKGGIGFSWPTLEATVYNNTIYDIGGGGPFDLGRGAASISIKNNISYVINGQSWYQEGTGFDWNSIITANNNIWYGSNQSLPSWDSNPITQNPLLIDPTAPARNFHLLQDSPAIDAGFSTSIARDMDGTLRPQGGTYDIGAYEYCSSDCPVADAMPPAKPSALVVK